MTLSLPRLALALIVLLGTSALLLSTARAQYIAPEGRLICNNATSQVGDPAQVTVVAQGLSGQPLPNEVVSFTVPGGGSSVGVTGADGKVTLLLTSNSTSPVTVNADLRGFGCTATVFSTSPEPISEVAGVFTPPIVGDGGLAGRP